MRFPPTSILDSGRDHNRRPRRWGRWRILLLAIALFLCLGWLFAAPANAFVPRRYTELEFPPLREVQIPSYQREVLPNGLVVYLLEDHELPMVGGVAMIRTGGRLEPGDKVGLASLVGEVIRNGGTTTRTAESLDQWLEQRAASVEVGIDADSGGASFNTLSSDLADVFPVFAEVIQKPGFPQKKLDFFKKLHQGVIERRNDDSDSISQREFQKLIYGPTSPYARTEEYDTLARITRADLVGFYDQYFRPDRMILGIVGDFDTPAMLALVKTHFGQWSPPGKATKDVLPVVEQVNTSGIFVVDQPQLTQSTVQMGHLAGRLDDPDVFALYVMNQALSSFGGRLFNEVRSRQGLAYSVYGVWSPGYDYPGIFIMGGQTRSTATVPLIQSLRTELARLRQEPLSPAELSQAKDSILNSFVFNFARPEQTLSRLMRYEYFGYPDDFIFRYQRAVKATTVEDVLAAAQRNLRPEELVTLVVGNRAEINPALDQLGQTVTPVDISIPATTVPTSTQPPPTQGGGREPEQSGGS